MSDDKTRPELFIIESLRLDDEEGDRTEGLIIKKILAMSGKHCQYYYIRTRRELERILQVFSTSQYRYLHLSCHANQRVMATTFDNIPLTEIGGMLAHHLNRKRLFVSACEMANHDLAKSLMPQSECFSILGPDEAVKFSDAAILWASLYHVLFAADSTAMTRKAITDKAQEVANMFRVQLNLFYRSNKKPETFGLRIIHPAPEVEVVFE